MTHTLHRRGKTASLERDYVVLVMAAQGFNDSDSSEKKRRALELALKLNPVNIGDGKYGNMFSKGAKAILANIDDKSIVHAVFDNKRSMLKYLSALKKADLGMSTVVSGVFDAFHKDLIKIGLCPHTVQYSLGTFGRTDLLPNEEILEVTTMCGHHMVAPQLVTKLVGDVKKGKVTPEVASRELAKQCVCGIFNPARAAELLEEMAGKPSSMEKC